MHPLPQTENKMRQEVALLLDVHQDGRAVLLPVLLGAAPAAAAEDDHRRRGGEARQIGEDAGCYFYYDGWY